MNRTAIRNFATWARTTLIEQVRSRLHTFGISEKGIIPAQNVAGDYGEWADAQWGGC